MMNADVLPAPPERDRPYHHGDLRSTLIEEGFELARSGGPAAVLLRDAARRAGVSHNAGYRHFEHRDDYLDAIAGRAMQALADAMNAALASLPGTLGPRERALARLSATGGSYVRFALAEPGLFRTAFSTHQKPDTGRPPADPGRDPYRILVDVLDGLCDVGLLAPVRRVHAEVFAWSTVHGLATLILDGPLRNAPPSVIDTMWQQVDEGIQRGLLEPSDAEPRDGETGAASS